MVIKSERIYTEEGVINGYLKIEQGVFKEISDYLEPGDCVDVDAGSCRVIPGIVDTHNHGTCGYSMMDGDETEVRGYVKGCASQGITGVFPTANPKVISAVARVVRENPVGSRILGIHSEGPWLNRTGEKGIRRGWPKVSMDAAQKMIEDGDGMLKLVAIAPEIPGTEEIIRYFLSQGITIALAHSDYNYEEAMEAYAKGISVSTHTGNVMTGLHHRNIGGLGAALTNDAVTCEVICDGMHICKEMLDIFFKLKNPSRFMMISDCTPFSGAPSGSYRGFEPGMKLEVTKEGFVISDTGRLCGSSQPVLYGIKNLVENLGMPIETVLRMASYNVCKTYGMLEHKGSIRKGKDADFVIISDDYQANQTYVEGKKVYDREEEGMIFNPEFLTHWKLE